MALVDVLIPTCGRKTGLEQSKAPYVHYLDDEILLDPPVMGRMLNVLFDRAKLLDVGGFSWWPRLPLVHAGEEVVVQFLLIRKYGGCGILPGGTYHPGLPTTIEDRTHNATELFEELVSEFHIHPIQHAHNP